MITSGREGMASDRSIKGVLWNFLGTYTSRNTEFDGYWLFGFLVDELDEVRIDLLSGAVQVRSPELDAATRFALSKFAGQVALAGLTSSQVGVAELTLRRLPEPCMTTVNGHVVSGHAVRFTATAAMTASARRYERTRVVVVAPHATAIEMRSARNVL